MPSQSLDLASFIAALLAVFVAPPLAQFMGVYAAIIIGAVFGAGLGLVLSREDGSQMRLLQSLAFVLLMTGVSLVVTVGAAQVLNKFLGLPTISPLLAPIALLIAAIGRHWGGVLRAAWASVLRVFEGRYGGPGAIAPPPSSGQTPLAHGRFKRGDDDE